MNKKGKNDLVVIVVVLALVALFFFIFSSGGVKTILEHKTPADISKEEEGTGLDLKFYDKDGNLIEIPDWFSTASVVPMGNIFTIVRHPPAPTCTAVSQCEGYLANPNIMCWSGKCVLGNVAAMDVGVNVQNPVASEISFLDVAPTAITPAAVDVVFDKLALGVLAPGQSHSWQTTSPVDLTQWEGTQQTFTISVTGTNQYTGQSNTVSDSITLAFDADPAGMFSVVVQTPVPA